MDPNSIVDFLKSTNQASDFASRTDLATQNGIVNYTGSAEQNTQLLNILKNQNNQQPQQPSPPTIPPITGITSPVSAPTPTSTPEFPEPTAPNIESDFLQSFIQQQQELKKQMDAKLKAEKEANQKKLEAAQIEKQGLLSKLDPTKKETFGQETRITQNQLDAAEAASETIQQNFEEKQRLVNELETLLTQGNLAIQQQRNMPVAMRVLNIKVNKTMQDVAARTGVINAVLSARDGQIAQAHNIINQARSAVQATWNDHLDYYQTLLAYNDRDILNLSNEQKDIADRERASLESDLRRVEANAQNLIEAMTDPDTALLYAQAGITMMDTPEEIATKIADAVYANEIKDTSNAMVLDGFTYLAPGQQPPAGSEAFTITDSRGKTKQYYKKAEPDTASGDIFNIIDPNTGEQIKGDKFDAARSIVQANPNSTEEALINSIQQNVVADNGKSLLTISDAKRIVEEEKQKAGPSEQDTSITAEDLLASHFKTGFFIPRSKELSNAKEKAKEQIDLLAVGDFITIDGVKYDVAKLKAQIDAITDAERIIKLQGLK